MGIRISLLASKKGIGVVYTPGIWTDWAIEHSGAYHAWLGGARIIDPNMGDGAFIESFIRKAHNSGMSLSSLPIKNLFGYEIDGDAISSFLTRMKDQYGLDLKATNFLNKDVLFQIPREKFDFAVGNPPWVSFADLPSPYKAYIKPLFDEYGLIESKGSVLLGKSRVDIAALVVNVIASNLIKSNGKISMFLPRSLFFGGAAHERFRKFSVKDIPFSLSRLVDFKSEPIFSTGTKHGTEFCFAEFTVGVLNRNLGPIVEKFRAGVFEPVSNSEFLNNDSIGCISDRSLIDIPKQSRPRQGLNTAGANSIFFGEISEGTLNDELVMFKNLENVEFKIESELVFPLLARENLKNQIKKPIKYVIVCHDPDSGKPFDRKKMASYKYASKYFKNNCEKLSNRRGVLIQSQISKYGYWSLFGVGPYAFAPIKIVWLTAGEKEYLPLLVTDHLKKPWMVNQSLQAFIPFNNIKVAREALKQLKSINEHESLVQLGQPGTLGWAQPGKIKKFLNYI